jgi:hypothetical protein
MTVVEAIVLFVVTGLLVAFIAWIEWAKWTVDKGNLETGV